MEITNEEKHRLKELFSKGLFPTDLVNDTAYFVDKFNEADTEPMEPGTPVEQV